VSWLRNSPHNSQIIPLKISPSPFFQRGVKAGTEKIPPLKKGDRGGFEFEFNRYHRVYFLNELLGHHTSPSPDTAAGRACLSDYIV